MQTIAAPEGLEIDGKYPLGTCLAEGERQAVYETVYNNHPAIIKIFYPESSRASSELLAGFAAAKNLQHPNLAAVHDFGQATLSEKRALYAVTERADDTLDNVLRTRVLDESEMVDLLKATIPALEYLHDKGFVHLRVRPSNILACGESVKLSADRLRRIAGEHEAVAPPGLHDAPETGAGVFGPAADVWSLAVLTLESLTGSPLESSLDRLHTPFRGIVQGGLARNPGERWTLRQISAALTGEALPPAQPMPERDRERPRYRKLGGIAIGGAVVTGAICAFLIRGAHHDTATSATPTVSSLKLPASHPDAVIPHAAVPKKEPFASAASGSWAVVGAAYHRQADAEKRAAQIRKSHPSLAARVFPSTPNASRYLVVFGTDLSAAQAKSQLQKARREGAPRGVYMTQLR